MGFPPVFLYREYAIISLTMLLQYCIMCRLMASVVFLTFYKEKERNEGNILKIVVFKEVWETEKNPYQMVNNYQAFIFLFPGIQCN